MTSPLAIKGHPKFGGRPRGQANRKDAILLAGAVTADRIVMREIIELSKAEALDKDGERMAGELEECVEEHGALVGYLSWLAEHYPAVYGSLLGRVLPLQVKIDSHKDIVYKTVEEIQQEIADLKLPMDRIMPLLISPRRVQRKIRQQLRRQVTPFLMMPKSIAAAEVIALAPVEADHSIWRASADLNASLTSVRRE